METTAATRAKIEEFEGCRLTGYQDQVGVWTIGYGHTGPEITGPLQITQAQADLLLTSDLRKFEIAVSNFLNGAPTTQNQFDAFISFTYNLGIGAFETSSLVHFHRAGQYALAAAEFPKWDHAGGVVDPPLLVRRDWEQALYLRG